MNEKQYCYTGKCPCGRIVAAFIVDPDDPKRTNEWLHEFREGGLVIEYIPLDDGIKLDGHDCPHEKHKV